MSAAILLQQEDRWGMVLRNVNMEDRWGMVLRNVNMCYFD